MRSYGQFCPVARASEILAERWTPIIVRNLLLGCETFTEIARGVPGMSRSLLTKRLRELKRAGVIEMRTKPDGRGFVYKLSEAGQDLWGVMLALAAWGERWLELQPEQASPALVLWTWSNYYLHRDLLPEERVVVRFEFPAETPASRRVWMLVEDHDVELCTSDPGFVADVVVVAKSEALAQWHLGHIEWNDALRGGSIRVSGPRALARAVPTWNRRACLAAPTGSARSGNKPEEVPGDTPAADPPAPLASASHCPM